MPHIYKYKFRAVCVGVCGSYVTDNPAINALRVNIGGIIKYNTGRD